MNLYRLKNTTISRLITVILILFSGMSVSHAEGGLSLSQTRVVFDASMKNTKVVINNQSQQVYLINSHVLLTPESKRGEVSENIPFVITPPLFRLEKESRNTVLISRNDTSALPTDRESIFYLSFLAIPSAKKATEIQGNGGITQTQVSFGIRTLIKLFYRPNGLAIPAAMAPTKLTFKQEGKQLQVTNPTPYYLTLAVLTVNNQPINVREQGAMIAPFAAQNYTVETQAKTVSWQVINDFGGLSERFTWSFVTHQ